MTKTENRKYYLIDLLGLNPDKMRHVILSGDSAVEYKDKLDVKRLKINNYKIEFSDLDDNFTLPENIEPITEIVNEFDDLDSAKLAIELKLCR